MVSQKGLIGVGFVAAHVVADHVNLLSGWLCRHHLGEERDELSTGMAWSSPAQHLARGDIQRRNQAQGAVACVFKAVTFGATGRERQDPALRSSA